MQEKAFRRRPTDSSRRAASREDPSFLASLMPSGKGNVSGHDVAMFEDCPKMSWYIFNKNSAAAE